MTRHIAIIGAGASGTLLAANIARLAQARVHVTLVEKRPAIGRGIAYAPIDPAHLLNTRVRNMSAFADDPDHFLHWLKDNAITATPDCFVTRECYGTYLNHILAPALADGRVTRLQDDCLSVSPSDKGATLELESGGSLIASAAVLATGHLLEASSASGLDSPWTTPLPSDDRARIAFVGTGLTTVDWVASLLQRGHKGPLIALSRRGLLPQPHAASTPLRLSLADIPVGSSLLFLTRWFRSLVRSHTARGGDWRDVVDGIRPHTQTLWRHLPQPSRRQFLRHLATVWDSHRHRMPPSTAALMARALETGQLTLVRGAFQTARRDEAGIALGYRPRGSQRSADIAVDLALDCRGIRRRPQDTATPYIRDLLHRGLARVDSLDLGLCFDPESRLCDAAGRPHRQILGIGPVTRAAFWEITAVPDIREQAARLAKTLLAG